MTFNDKSNAVAKTHPASREMLPDDPLDLQGFEVPGDGELMLRLLVEEYARMGWGLEPLMQLARDPNYTGFHGLWQRYGEQELRRRIADILSRTGVLRVTTRESEPVSLPLVQIEMSGAARRPAAEAAGPSEQVASERE